MAVRCTRRWSTPMATAPASRSQRMRRKTGRSSPWRAICTACAGAIGDAHRSAVTARAGTRPGTVMTSARRSGIVLAVPMSRTVATLHQAIVHRPISAPSISSPRKRAQYDGSGAAPNARRVRDVSIGHDEGIAGCRPRPRQGAAPDRLVAAADGIPRPSAGADHLLGVHRNSGCAGTCWSAQQALGSEIVGTPSQPLRASRALAASNSRGASDVARL